MARPTTTWAISRDDSPEPRPTDLTLWGRESDLAAAAALLRDHLMVTWGPTVTGSDPWRLNVRARTGRQPIPPRQLVPAERALVEALLPRRDSPGGPTSLDDLLRRCDALANLVRRWAPLDDPLAYGLENLLADLAEARLTEASFDPPRRWPARGALGTPSPTERALVDDLADLRGQGDGPPMRPPSPTAPSAAERAEANMPHRRRQALARHALTNAERANVAAMQMEQDTGDDERDQALEVRWGQVAQTYAQVATACVAVLQGWREQGTD